MKSTPTPAPGPAPSDSLAGALALAGTLACVVLALSPALVWADEGFDAARGRYEFADGRVMHLGGSARRPTLTDEDGRVLALAPLRDGVSVSADGRLAVQVVMQPNGIVTALRVTRPVRRGVVSGTASGTAPGTASGTES